MLFRSPNYNYQDEQEGFDNEEADDEEEVLEHFSVMSFVSFSDLEVPDPRLGRSIFVDIRCEANDNAKMIATGNSSDTAGYDNVFDTSDDKPLAETDQALPASALPTRAPPLDVPELVSSSDDEDENDDEDEVNKIKYIDLPNIDRYTRYVDDLICIGVSTDPIPSEIGRAHV